MHRFSIPSIPNDQWVVLFLALDGGILAFLALRFLAKVRRSATVSGSVGGQVDRLVPSAGR